MLPRIRLLIFHEIAEIAALRGKKNSSVCFASFVVNEMIVS